MIVEEDAAGVVVFASTYRPRGCYAGLDEFSVYVARRTRGRGAGRLAMEALIGAAEEARFWKLVSLVFPENAASRKLPDPVGLREAGTYEKHARLDGGSGATS